MKQIFLLCLFSGICIALQAQISISLEPIPAYATISPGNIDVPAYATVKNLTNETVTYKWEKIINNLPSGMTTAVCDINLCYLPSVNMYEFQLAPNQEARMDVHVYPNGNIGAADISVKVTEVGNEANTITGSYIFTPSTTSTHHANAYAFNISPNPVQDAFVLTGNTSAVSKIVLFNVIGRMVCSYNATGATRFDVSDLAEGIYLVRLEDRSGRALKTLRMVKKVVTP